MSPAYLPLLLLTIIGPIGAFDVIYYHILKFRLAEQPSARWETLTHLLRALFIGLGAYFLSHYHVTGFWFWAVGATLIFDLVNDIADILLEPGSRAPLGGIPPLEYLIHTLGMAFSGAITTAYFIVGWPLAFQESSFEPIGDRLPAWMIAQGTVVALATIGLMLFEGAIWLKTFFKPATQPVSA